MITIDLGGRNALITGGASGIGRTCAQLLHQAGARVAIVDINLAGARETAAMLGDSPVIQCDLSNPADVTRAAQEAESSLGQVDILVNCAGIIAYSPGLQEISVENWDKLMDVNLRGAFLLTRALFEGMKARRYGRIVNFASLAARVGGIEAGAHYAASKGGLISLTRTLARLGGPFNVTANAVAPGIIPTELVHKQIGGHEDAYINAIPLRRLGEPIDVARVVLFLVSPLADYLTGLVIDVNGGQYMG